MSRLVSGIANANQLAEKSAAEVKMNDNSKAAIAAGLWEPGEQCGASNNERCNHDYWHDHETDNPAPDMHNPANLWRALENRKLGFYWNALHDIWVIIKPLDEKTLPIRLADNPNLVGAAFAALVTLYDAEHKDD